MAACGGDDDSTGPAIGSIQVATSTTGADIDPDGYTLTVSGAQPQAIGVNGTVTLSNLPAGSYAIQLTGVEVNCTVAGENPRPLTVSSGGTAQTTFNVTCVPMVGDLEVSASTTGADIDPDGYTVTVDGGSGQTIGANGPVMFPDLDVGDHTVELTGVEVNCTVAGTNPRTVSVSFGGTSQTTFDVTCVPMVGDLEVSAATTGTDIDPDGYTVTVDGSLSQAIGVNGPVTFTNLVAGDHTVELTGVAANCAVAGNNPQTVSVAFGGTAQTSFAVSCSSLTGSLEVTTTTTGVDLDPDGYTVTVDGGSPLPIGVDGMVTFTNVPVGNHTVALTGLAANCSVGSNPRTVTVSSGGTAQTTFNVVCVNSQLGDLGVIAASTGVDLDPDGYTVTLDGALSQPIGVNDAVTFLNIPVGDHTVELTGVAANCTVNGTNPRTVNVPFQGAETTFDVSCISLTGNLEVTTSTTGADIDPDGYTATVDAGSPQAIGVNGTVTFPNLAVGDHSVELTGLSANCTVNGSNPRIVPVPSGGTAQTTFAVNCVALLADLDVITVSAGVDLDPDGYTVTLDGTLNQAAGLNDTVTFLNIPVGDHTVELTGVAANCSPAGDNPRIVSVPFGGAETIFDVTCVTAFGTLEVITSTSGVNIDPDGYTVTVDGVSPQPIGVNGTVTFFDVPFGDRTVELTGLAANCGVFGSNPRTVNVPSGGTASTSFDVGCFVPLSNQIAFDTDRDGNLEIYIMNADGTGQTNLTNDPANDLQAAVSRDGLKIAFRSNRGGEDDIWVMNPDGSGAVNLTADLSGQASWPAWSPDGAQVAFVHRQGSAFGEIWRMNADGTAKTRLTFDPAPDFAPAWSPDGTKIAFTTGRDGNLEIYVMNADGSAQTNLTSNPGDDFLPAWSPDGTKIAYSNGANVDKDIFVINPDGTGKTNLTNVIGVDRRPSWSADGTQIVFASDRDGNFEIYLMNADGTGQVNLTNNPAGSDDLPSWSP